MKNQHGSKKCRIVWWLKIYFCNLIYNETLQLESKTKRLIFLGKFKIMNKNKAHF